MVVYELPPSGDVFPRKTGSLVTMYTTPPARKSGVAGGILDCLIEEARNSGLIKLHLSATDQEVGLYRKAGFSSPLFSEMEPALEPE
jgi:N-acetylglutamate synthase-like GNAT family acetyltransferase